MNKLPANTLHSWGTDSEGKLVFTSSMSTQDAAGTHHLMSAFRLMDESHRLRGVRYNGQRLGELLVYSAATPSVKSQLNKAWPALPVPQPAADSDQAICTDQDEVSHVDQAHSMLVETLALEDQPDWKYVVMRVTELVDQQMQALALLAACVPNVITLGNRFDSMALASKGTINGDAEHRLADKVQRFLDMYTPQLTEYLVWPDGTVQEVEPNVEPYNWMSDDHTVVYAANEIQALRLFNEAEAQALNPQPEKAQ